MPDPCTVVPQDLWSPVYGARVYGYLDGISFAPGERVSLHAALGNTFAGHCDAHIGVQRMIHGDANPAGPGYVAEDLAWGQPSAVPLEPLALDAGSYATTADGAAIPLQGSWTVALWYRPTLCDGRWQALAAQWAPGEIALGIFLTSRSCLTVGVSHDGKTTNWCTGRQEVREDAWQFVAVTLDATTGALTVHQALAPAAPLERATRDVGAGAVHASRAPLTLAAISRHPSTAGTARWAHFEGRISNPVIFAEAIDAAAIDELAGGAEPSRLGRVVARWEFQAEPHLSTVRDESGGGLDLALVNRPARSVTGPLWDGLSARRASDRPEQYAAVHFHSDDLSDPRWPRTLELAIPADARTGIYAIRVAIEDDEVFLPFIVRDDASAAPVLLIVPTLTWQAYRSNREAFSTGEHGLTDPTPCLYDLHRDGSAVFYVSRRIPSRIGDPRFVSPEWGAHAVASDLYLLDWLEQLGIEYTVVTDEDLHARGLAQLEPFACAVLTGHPEYVTQGMLDALDRYSLQGGNIAYLGGNGICWVTSIAADEPWVMEVRKARERDHNVGVASPGEYEHSTSGEMGGLWAQRGRPPRMLLGVDSSSAVFEPARGRWAYRRTAESYDDSVAFVFAGVEEAEIGNFGLNLENAAAVEMDSVDTWMWPERAAPILLARAEHPAFIPADRPEFSGRATADMTIRITPDGGSVFSVGSISWTGSLSHDEYRNAVSRITENVIRHFSRSPHA